MDTRAAPDADGFPRWARRFAMAGLAAMAVAACASAPSIRSEYDRQADFSRYRTYAFFDSPGTDRGGYETLVTRALKSATRREMEARGYRYDTRSPDLRINFNGHLADRVEVNAMPIPPSEYYDYRSYATWRDYDVQVTQFTLGTLNVDVVDVMRGQLVWEGIASGPVTARVYRDRAAAIDSAVAGIFRQFPASVQQR